MLKVSAELNQEDIKNLLKTFSGTLVKKAVRSALDKTGTWGKKYLADDVSGNYNIARAKVNKAITVRRTTQTNLEIAINVKSSGTSILHDFKAWQDAIGTKANIKKGEIHSTPHAFINVARKGGGRFQAIRVGRKRYPTTGKPDRGPSITILVNRLSNREKRDRDLTNHLYKELADQIAKRTMRQSQVAEIE